MNQMIHLSSKQALSTIFSRNLSRSYVLGQSEKVRPTDQNEPNKNAQTEAAQLAIRSIKDMGSMFSSADSDDATQPINTEPIFKDPKLFPPLSLLHQGQVLKVLQEKFDKKWHKLSLEDKKLGYYIAYGNWGVRENFDNWSTSEPPYDLPFPTPSKVKTFTPSARTVIKKINPPVILSQTPVRIKQFDVKRIDGVSKFFIYLTLFIAMFAVYRDKNIGEAGVPKEVLIVDTYEQERKAREEEELLRKLEEKTKSNRKWYYLWLK